MAKLIVVPTPIGNLGDITLRALETLRAADVILCEDTRTTRKLLSHFEITGKSCLAYHIFNEHEKTTKYIDIVCQNNLTALVSDAGTPGISDPGYLIVKSAIEAGIEVECLPGATALIPALIQSGFPTSSFYFYGFLPHKKGKESVLRRFAEMNETVVFYESPHRFKKTLLKMAEIIGGERQIAIVKELSKIHAHTFRGSIEQAIDSFGEDNIKGEFVLILRSEQK